MPHLSISGSKFFNLSKTTIKLEELFSEINKFYVSTSKIEYQKIWSKTLFIKIQNNNNLNTIKKLISKKIDPYAKKFLFKPHINLIYNENLDVKIKKSLAGRIKFPKKILISDLVIVYPGNDKNYWRDVSKWKIVFKKELKQLKTTN